MLLYTCTNDASTHTISTTEPATPLMISALVDAGYNCTISNLNIEQQPDDLVILAKALAQFINSIEGVGGQDKVLLILLGFVVGLGLISWDTREQRRHERELRREERRFEIEVVKRERSYEIEREIEIARAARARGQGLLEWE